MSGATSSPRDVLPESSRYELLVKIAAGGMATVYVGRTRATNAGIRRIFAIKRAHAHLLDDAVFRKMFVAEARLASRIHHPNVVAVQDVEELSDELLLVMDYVEGVALADLRSRLDTVDDKLRLRAITRIVLDACAGLHAAHELKGDDGRALSIVHRDVSPHNILVGTDGIARLTDFGIAKSASHTSAATATGGLKGKIGYMAPEYVETGKADRRADVFAVGAVLWEALTGERLFHATTELEMMKLVARCEVEPPSKHVERLPAAIDAVVARALARDPADRFPSALELADALEESARDGGILGSHRDVAALVEATSKDTLDARRAALAQRTAPSGADVDSGSFAYEGHDRTATLDPTVQAPSAAPSVPSSPASMASTTVPAGERRPSRNGPLVVAAVAIASVAFAASRFVARPEPEPAREPAPASASASAPASALASASAPASAPAPASASAPASGSASAPASASAAAIASASAPASPSGRPRVPTTVAKPAASDVVAPAPSQATPAEPSAPLHAPPNPYRRDAGG